ncbi:hypothetical protein NDU88_004552 [Pleurodeles waltl]|uniref:Uncharacterized protein n=1 Tax=Pleurodeles waltl TaxID=8319 RepID=A0AAV7NJW5_PLEWA|nr:hypothetical protein NDU88_004552 [Pleurodeles waltl]
MENCAEELPDYDKEAILEEGEIVDEVTNVPGGLKKMGLSRQVINPRRSFGVFQEESWDSVQRDAKGLQSVRRSISQRPTIPRGKKKVARDASMVRGKNKVVRVVSVGNSPIKRLMSMKSVEGGSGHPSDISKEDGKFADQGRSAADIAKSELLGTKRKECLLRSNVSLGEEGVRIWLAHSKTDPLGRGQEVLLAPAVSPAYLVAQRQTQGEWVLMSEGGWGLEISGAGQQAARRPGPPVEAAETAPSDWRSLPCAGCLRLEHASRLSPTLRAPSPMRPVVQSLRTRQGPMGPRRASVRSMKGSPTAQSHARSSRACWHAAQQSVSRSVVPRASSATNPEQ